jgi:hypothetical protein
MLIIEVGVLAISKGFLRNNANPPKGFRALGIFRVRDEK